MPTGYTAKIANGETTSLREFALTCARGMGALITMRDEPYDAAIPSRLEPSTKYHDDKISAAQASLVMLDNLSPDDAEIAFNAANATIEQSRSEAVRRNNETRDHYKAMLAQLDKWPADNAPEGLHNLMYAQLVDSMNFDTSDNPLEYYPEPYATVQDWEADVLRQANRDLAYHTAERDKEIARTSERNAWLDKLWSSLEGVE
jgi:hypothetical protein